MLDLSLSLPLSRLSARLYSLSALCFSSVWLSLCHLSIACVVPSLLACRCVALFPRPLLPRVSPHLPVFHCDLQLPRSPPRSSLSPCPPSCPDRVFHLPQLAQFIHSHVHTLHLVSKHTCGHTAVSTLTTGLGSRSVQARSLRIRLNLQRPKGFAEERFRMHNMLKRKQKKDRSRAVGARGTVESDELWRCGARLVNAPTSGDWVAVQRADSLKSNINVS